MSPKKYRLHDGQKGAALAIRVTPRASKNEIVEILADGTVKVRLTAPPVEGEANQALLTYLGEGQLIVEVNRKPVALPVIRVSDDRGSERWFLDQEDNPLMLQHTLRSFRQTLASITTDKANTLRWIKGKKLTNPSGR